MLEAYFTAEASKISLMSITNLTNPKSPKSPTNNDKDVLLKDYPIQKKTPRARAPSNPEEIADFQFVNALNTDAILAVNTRKTPLQATKEDEDEDFSALDAISDEEDKPKTKNRSASRASSRSPSRIGSLAARKREPVTTNVNKVEEAKDFAFVSHLGKSAIVAVHALKMPVQALLNLDPEQKPKEDEIDLQLSDEETPSNEPKASTANQVTDNDDAVSVKSIKTISPITHEEGESSPQSGENNEDDVKFNDTILVQSAESLKISNRPITSALSSKPSEEAEQKQSPLQAHTPQPNQPGEEEPPAANVEPPPLARSGFWAWIFGWQSA
jgi:hypothetical protein